LKKLIEKKFGKVEERLWSCTVKIIYSIRAYYLIIGTIDALAGNEHPFPSSKLCFISINTCLLSGASHLSIVPV